MYPKRFFSQCTEPIDESSVFILMPFAPNFMSTYNLIKQVLEGPDFNLKCYRSDEIYKPGPIIETILRGIATSQFIIADVTGRNPNVFYELGIAHTVKENCIILTQSIEDVPFDLRHLHCIIYENSLNGADNLKSDLKKAVLAILRDASKKVKIEQPKAVMDVVSCNSNINDQINKNLPDSNLEVNVVDIKEYQLTEEHRHGSDFSYKLPSARAKLHIEIINNRFDDIDIISIASERFLIDSVFLSYGINELIDKQKDAISFPIAANHNVKLSFDAFIELKPTGNNAQFAMNLNKFRDNPCASQKLAIDLLDQEGNLIPIKCIYNFIMEPLIDLYILNWQANKQLSNCNEIN